MKSRSAKLLEKHWFDRCTELGCIVCYRQMGIFTPAAIHHIDGKTKPGAHLNSIPLCAPHHQHKDNHKPRRWTSRHGDGRPAFEQAYGTESELLSATKEQVGWTQ